MEADPTTERTNGNVKRNENVSSTPCVASQVDMNYVSVIALPTLNLKMRGMDSFFFLKKRV